MQPKAQQALTTVPDGDRSALEPVQRHDLCTQTQARDLGKGSMTGRKWLNLLDVAEPISLLMCKRTLEDMRQGEVLEIFMRDPVAVENLVKVMERSPDEVQGLRRKGDHFRIEIRKRR